MKQRFFALGSCALLLICAAAAEKKAEGGGKPKLPPEIADFRETLWALDSPGKPFEIVATDEMLAETLAWFLATHPDIPFSGPRVEVGADSVTGSGYALVLGFKTPIKGEAAIEMVDGMPRIDVKGISVAGARAPKLVLPPIEAALQKVVDTHFDFSKLPLTLDELDFTHGSVTAKGIYGRRNKAPEP